MKIAVIGAGAMGSIYGGHLSLSNEVYLIDTNGDIINHINENGLVLEEDGKSIVTDFPRWILLYYLSNHYIQK